MNDQRGFTLIEVVIALVILSVVMLGLAGTTGALLVQAAEDDRQATAVQLVHDRVDAILTDPDYDGLEAEYSGTETDLDGNPELERTTTFVRMDGGDDPVDAKKVTVEVDGEGLTRPVSRTVVVAPR